MTESHRIGVISDTHGLMRPSALAALDGVTLIVHAGDVGGASILRELRLMAPVLAVCGNVDDPHDPDLRPHASLDLGGVTMHVSHGHELGRPTAEKLLARYDADVIIFGHTHEPLVHRSGRRLVLNPGSAGPRRFRLKPSLAILTVGPGGAEAAIVSLDA